MKRFQRDTLSTAQQIEVLRRFDAGEHPDAMAAELGLHRFAVRALCETRDLKFHTSKKHRCRTCGAMITTQVCIKCDALGV